MKKYYKKYIYHLEFWMVIIIMTDNYVTFAFFPDIFIISILESRCTNTVTLNSYYFLVLYVKINYKPNPAIDYFH